MKIAFIIQSRIASTRLRGKILENIGNKKVLDWVIGAISKKFDVSSAVLAIPESKDSNIIEDLYGKYINIVRGPEDDVANRFLKIINRYDLDYVIRVCSDNPFIQSIFLEQIYKSAVIYRPDYISYYCNSVNCIKMPIGFFAEGFSAMKFKELYDRMSEYDREHVTPIFYEKGLDIKMLRLTTPAIIKDTQFLRFTLDSKEDLQLYRMIYSKYPKDYYSYSDLIGIIKSDKNIFEKMRNNYLLGGKK